MIDQQVVASVIEASNARIVDVVSDYVVLKKRGANYIGCCPFHTEKTPSFNVNPVRGIYKCFGCGKAGNAVGFVMEKDHLSFPEAIKLLGRKVGIVVEDKVMTAEDQQRQNERESMMAANEFARQHFIDNLWNNPDGQSVALPYFRSRGFRDDVIRKFDLGYSLPGRNKFLEAALLKGFKPEYLQKTGLAIFGEDGYRADRFFGRVMFPIHNLAGKVIAFGGRVMKKDEKTAKYVNSPESDVYHKNEVVYGLFHARNAIAKADTCYLVEGYTDVISMHQAGLENVVASCGTSLTTNQIRLISRYTQNVTVLYDGDSAGIKASMRGIDMLLAEGINVRVLLLPDGEDPDSFARSHSADEYIKFIEENQTDFIHFKARQLISEAGSNTDPNTRASLINNIIGSISKVQDRVLREIYVQDCSKLMSISEDTLFGALNDVAVRQTVENRQRYDREQQLQRYNTQRQNAEASAGMQLPPSEMPTVPAHAPALQKPQNPYEYEERELLRLIVKYGNLPLNPNDSRADSSVARTVADAVMAEQEVYQSQNLVFTKIMDCIAVTDSSKLDSAYFVNQPDPEIASLAADLLSREVPESRFHQKHRVVLTEEELLPEIVQRALTELRFKIVSRILAELKQELERLENDNASDDEICKLIEQIQMFTAVRCDYSKILGDRVVL